jgi:hypothetical protein
MDPDPDSAIFVIDVQDANKKLEGVFTSFFRDKKSKRSRKTVCIKVFLTIFA